MGIAVPRLRVHAESGDSESMGEVTSISIGYGLHQAWILTAIFGAQIVFGIAPASSNAPSDIMPISLVVNLATLLACGIAGQRLIRFVVDRRIAFAAAGICCAGTLLILVYNPASSLQLAIDVTAGVLSGFGSAVLLLFWGTAFARLDLTSIIMNTALAVLVSAVAYALLLVIPAPVSGLLCALIPLAEAALVWQHTPLPYTQRREVPIFSNLSIRTGAYFMLMGVPMVFFGLALGYLRQTASFRLIGVAPWQEQVPAIIISALIASLVLVIALNVMASDRIDDLIRPIVPLVAIGVLVVPVTTTLPFNAASWTVIVAYFVFEALMWIMLASFAQHYRVSPLVVFGIGRGALGVGTFFGLRLSRYLYNTTIDTGMFAGIMLVCLVFAVVMLPHVHDVRKAVSNFSLTPEAAAAVLERVNANLPESEPTVATAPKGAAETETETGPAQSPAGTGDEPEHHQGGVYRKKCESVADTYLLSNRESEVLFYLGKGFNAAYLQEKLFISEGTAKTHIRHIYGKTGVHSQQELMRLIDDTKVA